MDQIAIAIDNVALDEVVIQARAAHGIGVVVIDLHATQIAQGTVNAVDVSLVAIGNDTDCHDKLGLGVRSRCRSW